MQQPSRGFCRARFNVQYLQPEEKKLYSCSEETDLNLLAGVGLKDHLCSSSPLRPLSTLRVEMEMKLGLGVNVEVKVMVDPQLVSDT